LSQKGTSSRMAERKKRKVCDLSQLKGGETQSNAAELEGAQTFHRHQLQVIWRKKKSRSREKEKKRRRKSCTSVGHFLVGGPDIRLGRGGLQFVAPEKKSSGSCD